MHPMKTWHRNKSDWAASEAAKAWDAYWTLEKSFEPNYARKRRVLDTLRGVAVTWDMRVARYRGDEERRAA